MDNIDKETRSKIMSRIRSNNTSIEMIVRKFLHANGIRYRIHSCDVQGKPDISIKKYRLAIFINGCFWHGHDAIDCKDSHIPKTRPEWWNTKIAKTWERDRRALQILSEKEWAVITLWQCQIEKNTDETLQSLLEEVKKIKSKNRNSPRSVE